MKPLRPVVLNTLLVVLVAVMAVASLWWGKAALTCQQPWQIGGPVRIP